MDLTDIHDPAFLKQLDQRQLKALAQQIREFLIDHVSKTGGHLSSNLGVVELTIALHKVFDSPQDKIFFDVGHQCYTHKILTGRAGQFDSLRQYEGLSGFQKRAESEHPGLVSVGHADSPALRHGKTPGGGGCGQVGAVCHRAVLRPDGPGWFRGHRAADDL